MPNSNSSVRKVLNETRVTKRGKSATRLHMEPHHPIRAVSVSNGHKRLAIMVVERSLKNPLTPLEKIVRGFGVEGAAVETVLELSRRLKAAYENEKEIKLYESLAREIKLPRRRAN